MTANVDGRARSAFGLGLALAMAASLVGAAPGAAQDMHPTKVDRRPAAVDSARQEPARFNICAMVGAASGLEAALRARLGQQLAGAFPLRASSEGHHIRIWNPTLRPLECSEHRNGVASSVPFRAELRYQKTRGLPQYSTSGHGRFRARLVGYALYSGGMAGGIPGRLPSRQSDVGQALACLEDPQIDALDLRNVPNWFDDTVMRLLLESRIWSSGQRQDACIDITDVVRRYVTETGTLPGRSATGAAAAGSGPEPGGSSRPGLDLRRTEGGAAAQRPPTGRTMPPPSDASENVDHAIIDPCRAAPVGRVRAALAIGLDDAFPIRRSDGGQHVRMWNPVLNQVRCPGLMIRVRVDIRYQKTRGVPQFSTTGKLRFRAPVVAHIVHTAGLTGAELTPEDVLYAEACIQEVDVTELDLRRIPNWLDNTWIRNRVNQQFQGRACTDITQWVRLYIQMGRDLPI